jgi:hypothetical protein
VHQSDDLCAQNELKLTYEHLQVKKFFRGKAPGPPEKGGKGKGVRERGREEGILKGGEGRGGEGKGREGRDSTGLPLANF